MGWGRRAATVFADFLLCTRLVERLDALSAVELTRALTFFLRVLAMSQISVSRLL